MTYTLDMRKPYVMVIKVPNNNELFGDDPGLLPIIGIKSQILKEGRETSLCYFDIGCDRGHILPGKIKKHLPNGIVFQMREHPKWQFTMTELTMEEFEQRVRPTLNPITSEMLHDLDDVYTWYRQMVEMT